MSLFKGIVKELGTPDAQGRDWYGWASNQMSHTLLGVVVALHFPEHAFISVLCVAAFKELLDIVRKPSKDTIIDSFQDIVFWLLGAWIATSKEYLTMATILTLFALICGVVPRARKAVKFSSSIQDKRIS